ncbi:MAG: radical SAM family heme chaperone HemW [Sphaerochaetaceae bacterium]|nr:radical SAM family heme chaperone HemW [Sphaerochaetaceae bacterium]
MIDPYRPFSLYIHFPFCQTKCSYCAFYSEETRRDSPSISMYEKVLLQELKAIVDIRKAPFETVYIGGGNPGLASLTALTEILEMIHSLGTPKELSIEMNPESLHGGHAQLFEQGLSRLSIGIESLAVNHLRTLGRHATRETNLRAMNLANEFHKSYPIQLNFDLMTCIPGQTIADALSDIDTLIDLSAPEHISLYNLTVEEGTILAKEVANGTLQVIDEDQQAEMLSACWAHLAQLGYNQYEISNFSTTAATRCKHNERYWRLQDYIGIGPSAAGTIGNNRTTSDATIETYRRAPSFASYTLETMDRLTLMNEQLLMGLRTTDGIDKEAWLARYGVNFDQLCEAEIAFLEQQDPVLIHNTENNFALTSSGFMVLDAIVLKLSQALV